MNINTNAKLLPIEDIKPYENNPRINDAAVDYMVNSIKNFGFRSPILVDSNNVIICGHTRWKASLKLGLKEVPCNIADDMTPEQVKAFRIVDNKISEISKWDNELLAVEMEELSLADIAFDMTDFGFSEAEIAGLLGDMETGSEGKTETIRGNEKINADDYADEKFKHVCPKCGFKFN